EILHLKKFLDSKYTMINPARHENSKGKEVEYSIETKKKEIKIPKIKNEETNSNNPESNNNPKNKKQKN
ncbi:hypothetical protein ACMBCN_01930, partial [Candidatus Liberibacter asiaticus]|nr:hypothetical protein [Candidatus Liberibacter asiaticus]